MTIALRTTSVAGPTSVPKPNEVATSIQYNEMPAVFYTSSERRTHGMWRAALPARRRQHLAYPSAAIWDSMSTARTKPDFASCPQKCESLANNAGPDECYRTEYEGVTSRSDPNTAESNTRCASSRLRISMWRSRSHR